MKIAVTSMTTEIDGLVPTTFEVSPYLMVIDADTNTIFKLYKKEDEENIVFAQKVLEHDCEAIICGPLEKKPFELLANAGVTRYDGSGHTVQRAYDYMHRYKLKWLSDYIGGPGATGHSHTGACECGEDDE